MKKISIKKTTTINVENVVFNVVNNSKSILIKERLKIDESQNDIYVDGFLVKIKISDPVLKVYNILLKYKLNLDELSTVLDYQKKIQIKAGIYSQNFRTFSGSETQANIVNSENQASECILWCINHYTGLNRDKRVINASIAALKKYGTGSGTSALSCGHCSLHYEVEKSISAFVGKETALYFSTGYSTNVGAISSLCSEGDLILFDRECHASIVDGIKLSNASYYSFKHNDISNLKKKLFKYKDNYNNIFIIVESAYSMSGDLAPLKEICKLKDIPFYLYVDEAHTFGVYGNLGRGYCDELGITDEVDFIMSTLSKSTASVGGFLACNLKFRPLIEWKANSYIFQAAATPSDAATVLRSLEVIQDHPEILKNIHYNNKYMRELLEANGFCLGTSKSPIIPIRIFDEELLQKLSTELYLQNIFTVSVVYPAVKLGKGLLRFIVTSTHTKYQIEKTVRVLTELFEKFEIPKAIND
jgi:7-keto-8-aminopelargonate synthetase-like enzyme